MTFGKVLYTDNKGFEEVLLAEENGIQCVVVLTNGVVHLYRIEWWEDGGIYRHHVAYHLADALALFRSEVEQHHALTPITIVVKKLIHTDKHPLCGDETCPCHSLEAIAERIAQ